MKTKNRPRTFIIVVAAFISISLFQSCALKCLLQDPAPLNAYASDLKNTNHFMDSATAIQWIERYKVYKDSVCDNTIGSTTKVLIDSSESFNRAVIQQILCLKNCIGIRVFNGMDPSYKVHVILAGINQTGNSMFITNSAFSLTRNQFGDAETGLAEMGRRP